MRWISAPLRSRLARVGQLLAHGPFHRLTRLKIRSRQCRFVVSEDSTEAISCGAPTLDGSSWCPWHRQRGYASPSPREKYAEGSHFGEGARAHPAPPLRRSALGSHLLQCSPGNLSVPACHACSLPCQSQHAHLARGRRCKPIGAEALSHAARDFWGLSQKDKPLAQPIKQLWSSCLW